jgi:hypothetical protein
MCSVAGLLRAQPGNGEEVSKKFQFSSCASYPYLSLKGTNLPPPLDGALLLLWEIDGHCDHLQEVLSMMNWNTKWGMLMSGEACCEDC